MRKYRSALIALPLLVMASGAAAQCQPGWPVDLRAQDLIAGGSISSAVVFDDDGAGPHLPALYVSGPFPAIGDIAVPGFARWNGSRWNPVALNISAIGESIVFDPDGAGPLPAALYLIGQILDVKGIIKWDGQQATLSASGSLFFDGTGNPGTKTTHLFILDADGLGPDAARLYASTQTVTIAGGNATTTGKLYRLDAGGWTPMFSGGAISSATVWDPDGAGTSPSSVTIVHTTNVDSVSNPTGGTNDSSVSRVIAGVPSIVVSGNASQLVFDQAATFHDNPASTIDSLYLSCVGPSAAPHLGRLNGTTFTPITGDVNGRVRKLQIVDNDPNEVAGPVLYAMGDFTSIAGVTVQGLARRTPTASWVNLGPGFGAFGPDAVVAFDDDAAGVEPARLFAVGSFTRPTGPSNGIAVFEGREWLPPGNVLDNAVLTLLATDAGDGPALYAGGRFTDAGATQMGSFARWNGTEWSTGGVKFDFHVTALAQYNNGTPALVVGGKFTSFATPTVASAASHLAMYRSGQWSVLAGGGTNGDVNALATLTRPSLPPLLYVGGHFTAAGALTNIANIAAWDGQWRNLGSLNGDVRALTIFQGRVYAGGDFTSATNPDASVTAVDHIASFDGTRWQPLLAGVSGIVRSLAVHTLNGTPALYVGGDFASAGATPVGRIARWDGAAWTGVSGGIFGPGIPTVNALSTLTIGSREVLMAAGNFTSAGTTSALRLAYLDNNVWTSMGPGPNGVVYALAAFDADAAGPNPTSAFIGGDFSMAGGRPFWNLAQRTLCDALACYANCDGSTGSPVLTANDFQCFLNRFGQNDPYTNCDGSTAPPVLNVNDFQCFLNQFSGGCP